MILFDVSNEDNVLSFECAGNIASVSVLTVPALKRSHSRDGVSSESLARQWLCIYGVGKSQAPPVALVTSACLAYLAWSFREGGQLGEGMPKNTAWLYGAAALLTLGIVPYTLILMSHTNNLLSAKAAQALESRQEGATITFDGNEFSKLLNRWANYNIVRSLLPLSGAITALVAVVG